MTTTHPDLLDANSLIPDLLVSSPQLRGVLDRYGLRGCGGRLGPYETLGFFARAHDVPLPRLLADLRLALDNDPPATAVARPDDAIYRRFFLAGIAVVLTLGASWGAWLLLKIAWNGSFRAAGLHAINAHGHAQIFGWVGLFVMGFAYQAFPRFKHTDLRWPTWAFASWWLMLGGIIVRSVFEPLAASDPTWIGLVLAAGAAEVLAIAIFVGVLIGTWRQSAKPFVYYDAYIASALGWFLVQGIADALYAGATLFADGAAKTTLVATWQAPLRDIQIHGFAMLMILGVSLRMLHHVYGFREASAKLCLIALPLLNLAVIGEALGLILMRLVSPAFVALWYGSVIVLAATAVTLVVHCRLFGRAPEADRTLKFVRVAYAWLLISLGLTILMPAYQYGLLAWFATEGAAANAGFSHAFYGAIRHAITVGFISQMIVGVAARVVPTLNGLDGKSLPALWLPFILLNLGCTLRVAGQVATDFSGSAFPVAGVSGILEVSGLAIWAVHLVRIMLGLGRPIGVPSRDAVPIIPGKPLVGVHSVGDVLDIYPHLLTTFVEAGFRPLANTFVRQRLAHGITIDGACRLLQVDSTEFLGKLNAQLRLPGLALPVVESAPSPKVVAPSCSCCAERAAPATTGDLATR
ncbi:MAG: NnrS family protein [Gemmataceae bacterium]|nr:NnrS family protein [Gemmataceae bacterium]